MVNKEIITTFLEELNEKEIIILNYEIQKKMEKIKENWLLENKQKEHILTNDYEIIINKINTEKIITKTTIDFFNLLTSDYFWENIDNLLKEEQIETKKITIQ